MNNKVGIFLSIILLFMTYVNKSIAALKLPNNATLITTEIDQSFRCTGETHTLPVTSVITIILSIITIATAGGNFLVILAVLLVKKLRTPCNLLIVSLAFSDFLVGLLVLPFAIAHVIKGYWPFTESICDMFISFDVLLCTSSILNLCAISIDRYLVITRPLTYSSRRTPCMMGQLIAAAWIVSALISIPPNFGWKKPSQPCTCEYSENVGYQIYATICAFYLPLLVMIVLYGRIFKLAREMSKVEKRQVRTNLPDNINEEQVQTNAGQIDPLKNTNTDNVALKSNVNASDANGDGYDGITNGKPDTERPYSLKNNSPSSVHSPVPLKQTKGNADSKVITTLGVIMGCFCLCWLPFFIVQLLRTLANASGYSVDIPNDLFSVLQWLGYVNSFFNPIIYAKFNQEFRMPFKLILLCRCRNINARLRSVAYSTQFGLSTSSNRKRQTWSHSGTKESSRRRPISYTSHHVIRTE